MPEILITPAAENDLICLWRYIARDSREAATKVYEAARQTFEIIADMPGIGTVYQTQRTRLAGIRFFPVKRFRNYIIYYRQTAGGIEIIRVLHGRMDVRKRL